ncbi:acylphosphatase [Candidatus Bipolaricaulota bacterium]
METRLEARVYGLVQGVFFRHFTRQSAETLGLTGTVENLPDGTVRVIAEGEQDTLQALLAWLRNGPELARVDRVNAHWLEATGSFKGFRVLR